MDELICNNCGSEVPDYSDSCPNCGAQFLEFFENEVYKSRAKEVLKKCYWPAFAVSLIETVLVRGLDIADRINRNIPGSGQGYLNPSLLNELLAVFGVIWVIVVVYFFFIANPIIVGSSRYFITARDGSAKISDIFFAFKNGRYIKLIGAMAWQSLFQLLWTLLFIIPGIVKALAYCLTPYILAENPDIGYRRALKLSMQLTKGFKGDIFILQLSFIGWFLLGLLCLGVGILFVQPYYNSTMAEMYLSLKNNAIKQGICTETDFHGDNENRLQVL